MNDLHDPTLAGGLLTVAAVAFLLGARHATEPDHLTALATLALNRESRGSGRLTLLGLAWGLGHSSTLLLLGIPVILLGLVLPEAVQRGVESLVGVLIAALAIRLLVRWYRGYFHVHPHRHGESWHAHPHVHERAPAEPHPKVHQHRHGDAIASPAGSFVLGLIHGVGGSAGAGLLLVGAQPTPGVAVTALILFAGAAAVAMALFSGLFGFLLGRRRLAGHLERAIPVVGVGSLAFGVFYAVAAWGA